MNVTFPGDGGPASDGGDLEFGCRCKGMELKTKSVC